MFLLFFGGMGIYWTNYSLFGRIIGVYSKTYIYSILGKNRNGEHKQSGIGSKSVKGLVE